MAEGSVATAATYLSTGYYALTFNRDVTRVHLDRNRRSGRQDRRIVQLGDDTRAGGSVGFHLAALCP